MKDLEISTKLRRLIKMTLDQSNATVISQKGETDVFIFNNLALEYLTKITYKKNENELV